MVIQNIFWNVKKKELFTLCLWKIWNMNGWVRKDNWVSTFLSVSQIHNNKIEYVQSVFDREKLKPPLESSILQAIFPSGLSYTHNTTCTYICEYYENIFISKDSMQFSWRIFFRNWCPSNFYEKCLDIYTEMSDF